MAGECISSHGKETENGIENEALNFLYMLEQKPRPIQELMSEKVFNDTIHGHMQFHPLVVIFVDTRQIQRLRNLKQLGGCYFVFPSASHNRFEHSLGTAYIAGELFDSLKQKGLPTDIPDEKTWRKKKLCVQIAALCHDVGHGPFSHTWEKFRRKVNPNDEWTHEEESVRILDEIMKEKISPTKKINGVKNGYKLRTVLDAFNYFGLYEKDLEEIKTMILGREEPKNYLYQIVNNKNNDVDVDKWDYLARDSAMLNVPIAFDYKRLLKYCCVLPDDEGNEQICFREKEACVLVEMFLARGRLHDKAYQHRKVKIVEEMLVDALVFANERLKLTTTPITELTDHIYQKILYEDFGSDENMLKAKEILRRLESRHLYQCIARDCLEPDECCKFKLILQKIAALKPHGHEIDASFVMFDMTKSNKEKALKNVLVYNGPKRECKKINWDLQQDSLKFNLEDLKRTQVLFLYKGKEEMPTSLKQILRKSLGSVTFLPNFMEENVYL